MAGAPPPHRAPRSDWAAAWALACASGNVRASEAARTASRAAEPTSPVALSHWPPALTSSNSSTRAGAATTNSTAIEPRSFLSFLAEGPQPHAAPWLAWVRKHSIGPVTVSLMVSGQMPVILPRTVTETVPFCPAALCAVTAEIRLVSRPR